MPGCAAGAGVFTTTGDSSPAAPYTSRDSVHPSREAMPESRVELHAPTNPAAHTTTVAEKSLFTFRSFQESPDPIVPSPRLEHAGAITPHHVNSTLRTFTPTNGHPLTVRHRSAAAG